MLPTFVCDDDTKFYREEVPKSLQSRLHLKKPLSASEPFYTAIRLCALQFPLSIHVLAFWLP